MKGFLTPQWLWLFVAVAALFGGYVVLQLRRRRYAARFTNVALLRTIAPKRPGWRRHVAFGALLLSLAALTVAMARPTKDVKVPRDRATVMLVIDVSLSMNSDDVAPTRLQAAKLAGADFLKLLPAPINLGLVSFCGQTVVEQQPTTNRSAVAGKLSALSACPSTATGDALVAAVQALSTFQRSLPGGQRGKPAPARIVLLSDGARTVGRPVQVGVDAAKAAHIPVSTISFGTAAGTVDIDGETDRVPVDTDTMRQIAQGTGGSYHSAASVAELRSTYADIGSQVGYTVARREVTVWVVGIGAVLAFVAAGLSLLWGNRLL